jgi:hypothetical protein
MKFWTASWVDHNRGKENVPGKLVKELLYYDYALL